MHLAAHFSPELELQYTLFFRLCCRRTAGSWPVDPVDVDVDDAGGGRMCVVGDAVRAQERGGQHGELALGEALILLRLQALSVSWAHRDESAHGVGVVAEGGLWVVHKGVHAEIEHTWAGRKEERFLQALGLGLEDRISMATDGCVHASINAVKSKKLVDTKLFCVQYTGSAIL